ncbi:MAG TPA: hypothetical protein VMG98_08630 [Verrucomicrobiae bacterium]|nr:hypothetical protein [Verrucomicrobiae bacterium]
MMWIAVGGVVAALLLMLIAISAVIAAGRPTMRHAKALVPGPLRAKFVRVPDDLLRIQGAIVVSESLLQRANVAIETIRVAVRRT